jgi:carbamate kinase
MTEKRKLALIAIGGNSIIRAGQRGTIEEQFRNIEETCRAIVQLVLRDYRVIVTHGNGPQVGAQLLRSELGAGQVYTEPLDVCVADTQGSLGYMIQNSLQRALDDNNRNDEVGTVVTQVVVDENDPAFENPSKPVGPFYTEEEAREKTEKFGWDMVEDAARGYRRVVPSPKPLEVVEDRMIQAAVDCDIIVIAVGGGGIPVVRRKDRLYGIEAVIDKDRASALLARDLNADLFIISTDTDCVYINYKKPDQQPLDRVGIEGARKYLSEGQFPPGNMGPKIEAVVEFLENGGKHAIITSPENLGDAVDGKTGTHFFREINRL